MKSGTIQITRPQEVDDGTYVIEHRPKSLLPEVSDDQSRPNGFLLGESADLLPELLGQGPI